MEALRDILEGMITPRRMERLLGVLGARLGALRVVVENLKHPHNVNAVLRTCEALGVQHVHLVDPGREFYIHRRIAKGSHKWLTLHRHGAFAPCAAELHAAGFRLYAAMPSAGATPVDRIDVGDPVALVFGNESEGVSPEARDICDGCYVVPMTGFVESFNVSVAAAISIYDVANRMRRERPDKGLLSPVESAEILKVWIPKATPHAKRIEAILRRKSARQP